MHFLVRRSRLALLRPHHPSKRSRPRRARANVLEIHQPRFDAHRIDAENAATLAAEADDVANVHRRRGQVYVQGVGRPASRELARCSHAASRSSDHVGSLSPVPWVYLAAAAGVLVLIRILFGAVIASERLAAKVEEREENSGMRQRLDQFTR